MKKNYEELQINVISLEAEDVITASATRGNKTQGANFDFEGFDTQDFA